MQLNPGRRLGPYEIVSTIGAGGMGEVYRARDTRLERSVAIKVLAPHMAEDPDFRARFEREAKTVSSLDHPHICAVYDIGSHDGTDYLVMQYLDGDTLAARLTVGPLPLAQALRHAVEIADALDKAHRRGVIHRDLKPGNIMVTKSGAKLLDFGLAKPLAATPAGSMTAAPTQQTPVTAQGTILGTLQYMAPEQLEGRDADARSDIFSFGATLFEMITGRKAFEGQTQATLIGNVLHTEPPRASTLARSVPPALDRIVSKCLAKDPDLRWQSAGDLADELRWIAHELSGSSTAALDARAPAAGTPVRHRAIRTWLLIAAAVIAAALTAAAMKLLAPAVALSAVVRSTIVLPVEARLAGAATGNVAIAISPDGTRLVYAAQPIKGPPQLYLRRLDQFQVSPIRGTEGGSRPFFSPDGQWLGFFADGKLKKVLLSGGTPIVLADAANGFGASWNAEDTIVYSPSPARGLFVVSAAGGQKAEPLIPGARQDDRVQVWPAWLPGGREVVYVDADAISGTDIGNLMVYSRETKTTRKLVDEATHPRYASSGHLVFARANTLLAVPFDAARPTVTGTAVPVVDDVSMIQAIGVAHFDVAATGTLVYLRNDVGFQDQQLVLLNRVGAATTIPVPPRAYETPRFSPDGRRVALAIRDADPDIWVLDLARTTVTRLSFEPGEDESPVWSPDGNWLAWSGSRRGHPRRVYRKRSDGTGPEQPLFGEGNHQHLGAWSADGRSIVFSVRDTGGDWRIARGVVENERWKVEPLIQSVFGAQSPALSPDGQWIAYVSRESGRGEVYVQPFPAGSGKWQISTDGGAEPVWARSGKELFYRNDDRFMVAAVTTGASFSADTPRLLFEGQFARIPWLDANYDATPDGQRFITVKGQSLETTNVQTVTNWFRELADKVKPSR